MAKMLTLGAEFAAVENLNRNERKAALEALIERSMKLRMAVGDLYQVSRDSADSHHFSVLFMKLDFMQIYVDTGLSTLYTSNPSYGLEPLRHLGEHSDENGEPRGKALDIEHEIAETFKDLYLQLTVTMKTRPLIIRKVAHMERIMAPKRSKGGLRHPVWDQIDDLFRKFTDPAYVHVHSPQSLLPLCTACSSSLSPHANESDLQFSY
jgi:hypothetical protein